jgi:CRP-like cAMP-binding protein
VAATIGHTSSLFLAALPPDEREQLNPFLRAVALHKDLQLCAVGEPIDSVYFPNGGVCSLTMTMEDGRVAEVGLVGREGLVGHLTGFGQDVASHDAMVQIPDGSALAMSRRDFRAQISRSTVLHALVSRYMLAATALMATSVACNALHHAEERCARWLLHAHDRVAAPDFQLSHEFLAMMLGVRRPTATIVAGTLQRAGLISYKRGHMTIVDRERLEEASCECYAMIEPHYAGLLPAARVASV